MKEIIREGIKILIFENKKIASKWVAEIICGEIKRKKNLTLGLASGATVVPLYNELSHMNEKNKIDFSQVKTFNLDEYAGLKKYDAHSLRYFMDKNFFNRVNLKKNNINFLSGDAKKFGIECKNYERKIKKAGGIDLQILGIGINGHIGFNEPGSSIKSTARKIRLSETTRRQNLIFFSSLDKVPKYALTVGIKTILKSKKIILLAFGKDKAEPLARAVSGRVAKSLPASFLTVHPKSIFVVDKLAAAKL